MVDLAEFVGDIPERRRLIRQIEKARERLDKIMTKATPLQADLAMYNEMLAAIDKRMALCPVVADDLDSIELNDSEILETENTIKSEVVTNEKGDIIGINLADGEELPAFLRNPAGGGNT